MSKEMQIYRRSQWPRGLRRRSTAARLLRSWVRNPSGAWLFVCCEYCVLSGRGLCDELITRPGESYRLWCVVCDLEKITVLNEDEGQAPLRGYSAKKKNANLSPRKLLLCSPPRPPKKIYIYMNEIRATKLGVLYCKLCTDCPGIFTCHLLHNQYNQFNHVRTKPSPF